MGRLPAALLLLHGWPELWLTWEPALHRLAGRFELIAPDLRGFGDSDEPTARARGQGALQAAPSVLPSPR